MPTRKYQIKTLILTLAILTLNACRWNGVILPTEPTQPTQPTTAHQVIPSGEITLQIPKEMFADWDGTIAHTGVQMREWEREHRRKMSGYATMNAQFIFVASRDAERIYVFDHSGRMLPHRMIHRTKRTANNTQVDELLDFSCDAKSLYMVMRTSRLESEDPSIHLIFTDNRYFDRILEIIDIESGTKRTETRFTGWAEESMGFTYQEQYWTRVSGVGDDTGLYAFDVHTSITHGSELHRIELTANDGLAKIHTWMSANFITNGDVLWATQGDLYTAFDFQTGEHLPHFDFWMKEHPGFDVNHTCFQGSFVNGKIYTPLLHTPELNTYSDTEIGEPYFKMLCWSVAGRVATGLRL